MGALSDAELGPLRIKYQLTHAAVASLFFSVALVSPAHANIPSTILWTEYAHAAVGNLLIGLVEGSFIALVFRTGWTRSVGWMIAANYFSTVAGLGLISTAFRPLGTRLLGDAPLHCVGTATIVLALSYLAASALLEMPFCMRLFGSERRARKALAASLAAQVVSYGLLVPFYLSGSQLALYEEMRPERSLSFVKSPEALVFYLGLDGDLYRIRADGTGKTRVAEPRIRRPDAWLSLRSDEMGRLELRAMLGTEKLKPRVLLTGLHGYGGATERKSPCGGFNYYWGAYENDVIDLRQPPGGPHRVCADSLPWYGLMVRDKDHDTPRTTTYLGFETPFFAWDSACPNVLPGDQVVYQLGDQIVVGDLNSRQIGLIARGRGPVVVLPDERKATERESSWRASRPAFMRRAVGCSPAARCPRSAAASVKTSAGAPAPGGSL